MKLFTKLMLMLSLCLVVFGLMSCKGNTEDPDANGTKPTVTDNEVIFSPYVNTTLVLGEGVKEADIKTVKTAYYNKLGKELKVADATAEAEEHEIIIGKNDRDLSQKAYRYLVALENDKGYVGYVICSDGKSVAIAYNEKSFGENVAFNEAVDFFVSKQMGKDTLKYNAGIVHYAIFDPITKQQERDDKQIEMLWDLKLSQLIVKTEDEDASNAILSELKMLRQVFAGDDNIVTWLANLYDPGTGGFYYSNSARNNETYLPDLESTNRAIGLVEAILTGYSGNIVDYFGEEIAEKFVTFVNNMQASDSGYFYHPQWPRDAIDNNATRRDRDLLDAIGILETFSASPRYDTPNGIKGSETVTPVSGLTTPLGKSVARAVSTAVGVAEAPASENEGYYIPPYLSSVSEFTSYLSGLGFNKNTASACNKVLSEISMYKTLDEYMVSQGKSAYLVDTLKKTIARYQLDSGLWSSDDNGYTAMQSLVPITEVYNALGEPVPDYADIFLTATKVLRFTEEVKNITDISGSWSALATVVNNLVSYTKEEQRETLGWRLADLYASLPTAISTARAELSKFKRNDGAFSSVTEGNAYTSYDMPVALPLMEESDMIATFNATKTLWYSVFIILDTGTVPVFTASDRMLFQKTLLDLGVVIKNEIAPAEPIDFEKYNVGDTSDVGLSLKSINSYARVINDPLREGRSLHLYSAADKGAYADNFNFAVTQTQRNASCFVVDFDMLVNEETSQSMFGQIQLVRDVYILGFVRKGDEIRFIEKTGQGFQDGYVYDLGVTAKVGEWFNFRLEFYPGTRDTVRAKLFLNGDCVAVSDLFKTRQNESYTPLTTFNTLTFLGYPKYTLDAYIDNIVIETTYKAYTPETGSLNRNIDTPDGPQTKHDFEGTTLPSGMIIGGGLANATITDDPNNGEGDTNKVLSVNEKAGLITLPLTQRGSGINSALIEFDLTVDESTSVGTVYNIGFKEYHYDNRVFAIMQILIIEEQGKKYAIIAEASTSGATGIRYDATKMELGKNYKVAFHLFFNERVAAAFVDGEVVGISTNVSESLSKGYMGITTFEVNNSALASKAYIDNLVVERAHYSFEEVTAPAVDRETGSFDDEGKMTFEGVAPSGGTLAFNTVGSVKVPVNQRVNVPTIGLFGFDVISSSFGAVAIELQDEAGNIIASFTLRHTDNGVELFEITENGKYPKSIHTISSESFNISVEYSATNESLNFLVDGEYAAATSLIYKRGSAAHGFDFLVVKSAAQTGFAIDNIYAEKITAVFKGHTVSLENEDNKNETLNFETSSFASMPEKVGFILGSPAAYHRIVEDKINGEVTKALLMYCSPTGATYTNFKKTFTAADANAVFFETDIKIEAVGTGTAYYMFAFQANSLATDEVTIKTAGKGASLVLSGAGFSTTTLNAKENEWFKLRVEYADTSYDFNYDGTNDYIFRIYINGSLIGEKNNTYKETKSSIASIRTRNSSNSNGYMYFDNSTMGEFSMSYTPPAPADTDTVTYEQGMLNTQLLAYSAGQSASSYSFADSNIAGRVTKVLDIKTASGSQDMLTVKVGKAEEGANALTFETYIKIAPVSDTATLYLEPKNAAGKQACRLVITAEKNGDVKIAGVSSGGKLDKYVSEITVGKTGEWIKLKVQYMSPRIDYTGDKIYDVLYRVFAEDLLLATGYQTYTTTSYFAADAIESFVLTMTSDTAADVYLDETKLWRTVGVEDEAPEFDENLGKPIGGSGGYETDGWV